MGTSKEDFMDDWRENIRKLISDLTDAEVEITGNNLWMGRDIMYAVVDNDDFDLLMHRYYHGVAAIRLNLLMIASRGEVEVRDLSEQMFALGFVCGKADERGWDVDTVAPAEESLVCVGHRHAPLATKDELDQADSLPIALVSVEDVPADEFKPTPPPDIPPEIDEGGGYFQQ